MKCVNCDSNAHFTVADPGVNAISFCNNCLPKELSERAKAGHFKLDTPKSEKKTDEPVI